MTKKGTKHFGAAILEEVLQMKREGKTHAEISLYFGFPNKFVIKKLVERYNRKQRKVESGVLPRKKGRPRKTSPDTLVEKDQVIKQLTMENELLRSFLSEVGRR